ncbi:MAG: pyridoxamine 5'-phosphate oxidase family protein, partial [Spirochaetaceae bacterium]|nr:pyridoxamine 5'-phosphate oxidase family protein [Spirochaetaceae bacterium]
MDGHQLRRQDREIKDEAEIRRILRSCRYATVAMAKGGEPYLVTMNYGYDEAERRLYFHCATKGQKTDFLEANRKVCASIILDGGYIEG